MTFGTQVCGSRVRYHAPEDTSLVISVKEDVAHEELEGMKHMAGASLLERLHKYIKK